jgi:hypothetical protein
MRPLHENEGDVIVSTAKRRKKNVKEEKENMSTGVAVARQRSAAHAKERVLVEFPVLLLKRTEEAASQLATDRSKFIRAAVEEKVANMQRQRLEEELAAAYAANSQFDLKLSADFKHVDGENF